ncbi:uncharacterized protein LAESUDRAFT_530702 [Laetiporus sulphureus 93-53]|uniref:Uncharacterized protein n=1 Tax=Laetiporus sulphureus 93-53 TaxID=1314785 RepID=A0A165BAW2_9APHY|nr:uncharacterized protein LAESUDRAFT_530702 [Laetiporus sulphureus 93-53]KZT00640.1 hypothetical protein LAESUDRAFT_530702 [Laetiporus sulphureus 93-53]
MVKRKRRMASRYFQKRRLAQQTCAVADTRHNRAVCGHVVASPRGPKHRPGPWAPRQQSSQLPATPSPSSRCIPACVCVNIKRVHIRAVYAAIRVSPNPLFICYAYIWLDCVWIHPKSTRFRMKYVSRSRCRIGSATSSRSNRDRRICGYKVANTAAVWSRAFSPGALYGSDAVKCNALGQS